MTSFDADLSVIRRMALLMPGPLPTAVNGIRVAASIRPRKFVVEGGDDTPVTMPRTAFQVVWTRAMKYEHGLQKCVGISDILLQRYKRSHSEVLLATAYRVSSFNREGERAHQALLHENDIGADGITCWIGHENLLGLKSLVAALKLGARNAAPESHQKAGGPLCSGVQTAQT